MMETSLLTARLAFGAAAELHYVFVPVSIGLAFMLAAEDGVMFLRARKAQAKPTPRMSDLLHRLFLLTFAFGVLTGRPLRQLLQTHWGGLAQAAPQLLQDVFGFEQIWSLVLFGAVGLSCFRRRFNPGTRAAISLACALALVLQSAAITALNAFLEYPYGAVLTDGLLRTGGPSALALNPMFASKITHILAGAMATGAVGTAAVCAFILKRTRSASLKAEAALLFRRAGTAAALALAGTAWAGHAGGLRVLQLQPVKFAAMEGLWTPPVPPAPLIVAAWPDAEARANRFALQIPGALGLLTNDRDRPLPGLTREPHAADSPLPPQEDSAEAAPPLPPVGPVFFAFRIMLGCWALCFGWSLIAAAGSATDGSKRAARALTLSPTAFLLTLLAGGAGWIVCEVGRQPWIVTGLLRTAQAHTPAPSSPLWRQAADVGAWGAVLAVYVLAGWYCVRRTADEKPLTPRLFRKRSPLPAPRPKPSSRKRASEPSRRRPASPKRPPSGHKNGKRVPS